jgi:NAD(P)-dependent dehydrogenase (short-subunit alcohol dehydrogenase family)
MRDLQGKVAVITGAGSGIGRAVADRLAAEGMRLVVADIQQDALDDAAGALRAAGAEVVAVPTDVTQLDQIEALRDAALAAFGAVHLVHNNAGVASGGRIWEVPLAAWRWVIDVDLWSVIYGMHVFAPVLLEQGEGHIVNTSSIAGLTSPMGLGPYNVAKHGVVALSETLANELAGTGVGVSVLCPGFVRTRIYESDRNAPPGVTELAAGSADDPEAVGMREMLKAVIEAGLDPTIVADQVLDAVLEDRFYILTHPESVAWVENRMTAIVEGKPPALGMA